MPNIHTSLSPRHRFATALFIGLLWGIGVATAIACILLLVLDAEGRPVTSAESIVMTIVWTVTVASVLAVFPIGPLAGFLGWQLFRRGVVAPWAYAAVGGASAVAAPALILMLSAEAARTSTMNLAVLNDGVVPILMAAFFIIGAFAGFMAGRVIWRGGAA